MIDVREILSGLRDARRERGIDPEFVPYSELREEVSRLVRAELNRMHSEGLISVKQTLNEQSIECLY